MSISTISETSCRLKCDVPVLIGTTPIVNGLHVHRSQLPDEVTLKLYLNLASRQFCVVIDLPLQSILQTAVDLRILKRDMRGRISLFSDEFIEKFKSQEIQVHPNDYDVGFFASSYLYLSGDMEFEIRRRKDPSAYQVEFVFRKKEASIVMSFSLPHFIIYLMRTGSLEFNKSSLVSRKHSVEIPEGVELNFPTRRFVIW